MIQSGPTFIKQVTHFIGYTISSNVENSYCNWKIIIITFDVKPIICVSFASESKTQVKWANGIG